MADFLQRDPRSPAFWDERFERAFTHGTAALRHKPCAISSRPRQRGAA
jgi:hypothetical protein